MLRRARRARVRNGFERNSTRIHMIKTGLDDFFKGFLEQRRFTVRRNDKYALIRLYIYIYMYLYTHDTYPQQEGGVVRPHLFNPISQIIGFRGQTRPSASPVRHRRRVYHSSYDDRDDVALIFGACCYCIPLFLLIFSDNFRPSVRRFEQR